MAASILSDGPVALHTSLYPTTCLSKAIDAYREILKIEVVSTERDSQIVSLNALPTYIGDTSKARQEFLNYLLDLAVQHHLAVE